MLKDDNFLSKTGSNEKYYNEDYIQEVFEKGEKTEVEKIKEIHGLTDEQVDLFCKFAVLKKNMLTNQEMDISKRKESNTKADDDELSMGVYREYIEPQVLNAVLNLRKKGYSTFESGFGDFDSQIISFEEEHLKNFDFPGSLYKEFESQGIKINISPSSVELKFSSFKNLDEIKILWQKIEDALPDLGKPAKPCELEQAKNFRMRPA